jgi:hypothetical protein
MQMRCIRLSIHRKGKRIRGKNINSHVALLPVTHAPRTIRYRCHRIRQQPFNDGNKRIALLATRAFLYLNGQELEPSQADEVTTLMAH